MLVDIWLSYSKGRVILLIGELVIEFVVDYLVTFVFCGKDNGVPDRFISILLRR